MRFVGLASVVGSLAGLGASGCDSADNGKSPAAQARAGEPPPRVATESALASPTVEPEPSSPSAAARADALISTMTLDQKLQQIYNLPILNEELQDEDPPCEFQRVGRHIEGIPELGIPTMRFANGGTGIRGGDCLPEPEATAFPSNIAAAATFDPEINLEWGQVLGDELRAWAHQGLLGPAFNTIRTPWGGRNHEYMSEDPYLTGVLATQQVLGIQSNGKTHAIVKHIVGNESEYQRERWTAASRIPSRAMHEIYLLPFEMTIKDARPAAVMCSYPDLNFHWSCENAALLKQTLRERWGFDGYVMSDRAAMHSTVPSILAGTGIELDFEPKWYAPELIENAIAAGEITEADIDALLRPRYTKSIEFGQFDEAYDAFLPVDLEAHSTISRKAGDGSVVLLKNDGLLPLNAANVRTIALIGADWFAGQATMPPRGLNRDTLTNVRAAATVTPQQGLANTLMKLGSSATITYSDGDVIADAVTAAENADIAIVMVGDNPRETWDKTTLSLPSINGTNQDLLVPRILAANRNTVVVLKTEGSVLMPWLPQARALVEAWYPGQNDGDVVADVLFGVTNPSGKLPVTFGNTANEAAYETEAQYPGVREDNGLGGGQDGRSSNGSPQLVTMYNENLKVGYRWYEAQHVTPVFPFGHGLSYTTYAYSDLTLATTTNAGGQPALTVSYTVANTGAREGREATQVYLTLPPEAGEPSKRLVGFKKITLQPSESQQVVVTIDCTASNHPFSYFMPANEADLEAWANGDWVTPSGQFTISVGTSSADTPLQSPIELDLTACTASTTSGGPT
jgi:beta-glucosidase